MCFSCAAFFKLFASGSASKQAEPLGHCLLTSSKRCMGKDKTKNVRFGGIEVSDKLAEPHTCNRMPCPRASDDDVQQTRTLTDGAVNPHSFRPERGASTEPLAHYVRVTLNHFVLSAAPAESEIQDASSQGPVASSNEQQNSQHGGSSTECVSDDEASLTDKRWAALIRALQSSAAWHGAYAAEKRQNVFQRSEHVTQQNQECLQALKVDSKEDVAEYMFVHNIWTEQMERVHKEAKSLHRHPEDNEDRRCVAEVHDVELQEEVMVAALHKMDALPHRDFSDVKVRHDDTVTGERRDSLSTKTASAASSSTEPLTRVSLFHSCCVCCTASEERTSELHYSQDIIRHSVPYL